jgi:hypothetical protein
MKTKTMIIAAIATLFISSSFAQNREYQDHIWTYEGEKKEHTLGLYGGINLSYSPIREKDAYNLGAKAVLVFDNRFGIGLAGKAVSYDHETYLPEDNRPVRLEAGYTGIILEYIQPLGNRVKLSFSLLSGSGLVQYRYHKDLSEELTWTEEIPDRTTYSVLEPGLEFQTRLSGKWWIGLQATYRFTSPVKMLEVNTNILETYTAGISIHYGIF